MRRKIIFTLILFLLLSINPLLAADGYKTSLTGSSSSSVDNLVISNFAVSGSDISNVKGSITYDSKVLAIYKVEPSIEVSDWAFDIDTSKAGTISFDGKSNDASTISSSTVILKITFVVIDTAKSTKIATKDVTTQVVSISQEIANQDDIDKYNAAFDKYRKDYDKYQEYKTALENGTYEGNEEQYPVTEEPTAITPVDPVYQDVETVKTVTMDKSSQSVTITAKKSKNAYLKAVKVNGTLTPTFAKLTNNYTVTLNKDQPFEIDYVAESPKSTVTIDEEVNNQVVVTVKSEDGSSNLYVFTINRIENEVPVDPTPSKPDQPAVDVNVQKSQTIIAYAGAGAGVAFIILGSVLVYKGAHFNSEESEDEE